LSARDPLVALLSLRQVRIWIHYHSKTPCMAYHPSAQWLRQHDFNPAMARGIEIGNARTFLDWPKQQPWMVLHELVLGFDEPRIREAFAAARQSGVYDTVLHLNGKKQRHDALKNHQEYFAESIVAFFGANDFYPFVRAEFAAVDPHMYGLLKRIWGDDARP